MKKEPFCITPQMAAQERLEEFKKVIPAEFPEELKGDFALNYNGNLGKFT